MAVLAPPAASIGKGDGDGGVRVRVLRLEGAPAGLESRRLAVRVSIGTLPLYTTPYVAGRDARWGNGLRAWTASSNPIVFEVLAGGGAPAANPPRHRESRKAAGAGDKDDSILESGLDHLVADYGMGTLDEGAADAPPSRPGGPVMSPFVRVPRAAFCVAKLDWLPADGEHRLECGGATLVVTTKAVRGKPR
jgi:hypothetical protein